MEVFEMTRKCIFFGGESPLHSQVYNRIGLSIVPISSRYTPTDFSLKFWSIFCIEIHAFRTLLIRFSMPICFSSDGINKNPR